MLRNTDLWRGRRGDRSLQLPAKWRRVIPILAFLIILALTARAGAANGAPTAGGQWAGAGGETLLATGDDRQRTAAGPLAPQDDGYMTLDGSLDTFGSLPANPNSGDTLNTGD